MIKAGVAARLPKVVWLDAEGNHVEECITAGYKVNIEIIKPEMCIVAAEVGGNTSQKDDGKIGGERWLTEISIIPQRKISTRNKHYTVLGTTLLDGKSLMCIVIMA